MGMKNRQHRYTVEQVNLAIICIRQAAFINLSATSIALDLC